MIPLPLSRGGRGPTLSTPLLPLLVASIRTTASTPARTFLRHTTARETEKVPFTELYSRVPNELKPCHGSSPRGSILGMMAAALEVGGEGQTEVPPLTAALPSAEDLVSLLARPFPSRAFRFEAASLLTLTLNVTPSRRRASLRSTSRLVFDFIKGGVAQMAGNGACRR